MKGKSPGQISDWLVNLSNERYLQWHPAHRDFRYIRKTENFIGSLIYFDEIFEGVKIKNRWKVLEFKKDESILLRAGAILPIHLRLSAEERDENTEITHELLVGFSFGGLENIVDWFIRKLIFTERKMRALERHTLEEFQNLENII